MNVKKHPIQLGKVKDLRLAALVRFAIAITVLNILGHTWLGFETSWAHPVAALLTAYSLMFLFEWLVANAMNRKPQFQGGPLKIIYFLLPGHITAMAISMLLFTNEGIMPMIFATAIAILSKVIFRVSMAGKSRHFLNPSNTGIAVVLILFPWVGIAPPYHFTENTSGIVDWILPLIIVVSGSFLNWKYTQKSPLILAWIIGFFLQALIRSWWFDTPLIAGLIPITGMAFLLFTFYMVSDPATSPRTPFNQVLFGLGVAFVYGLLMAVHIVFGLFFALFIVCIVRGAYFYFISKSSKVITFKQPKIEIEQLALSHDKTN